MGASCRSAFSSFFVSYLLFHAQIGCAQQQLTLLQRAADQAQQFLRRVRLQDEVKRPQLDRFNDVLPRVVGGEDDHLHLRKLAPQFAEDVDAVRIRQPQIEEHQVRLNPADQRCAGCGRIGAVRLVMVAPEESIESEQDGTLIVNDDYPGGREVAHSRPAGG